MATRTKTPHDEGADGEKAATERRYVAIIRSVMTVLGLPSEYLQTTIRAIGSDTYRLNVIVGPDISAARIAHSYFVTAADDGKITASTPPIVKQY